MILLLDTSTPLCKLTIADTTYEWEAGRQLADGLLKFINDKLQANEKTWSDITALGVYEGPGSFTGLRIGIAVMNTLADGLSIPIVGARGDRWRDDATKRLNEGENQQIVLPFYGQDPHITAPKK